MQVFLVKKESYCIYIRYFLHVSAKKKEDFIPQQVS